MGDTKKTSLCVLCAPFFAAFAVKILRESQRRYRKGRKEPPQSAQRNAWILEGFGTGCGWVIAKV
jgi:hypothetical protein